MDAGDDDLAPQLRVVDQRRRDHHAALSVELGLGGAGEHVALHPARLLAERIQRGESRLDESSPILTTVGVEAAFEATGDEDALSECLPELGRESKAILVIERVFVLAEEHR